MKNIILIVIILLYILFFYLYSKEKKKNKEIENINIEKKKQNEEIENKNKKLIEQKRSIEETIDKKQNDLLNVQNSINNANEVSKKAFENYAILLDKLYLEKEDEYNKAVELLHNSYAAIQSETLIKIDNVKKDLDKISATRAAAIKAQLKEEEIQEKEKFYSLSIDEVDKREIKILQSIEKELRDPRPLRMII